MLLALLLAIAGSLETSSQPDLCWGWGAPQLWGQWCHIRGQENRSLAVVICPCRERDGELARSPTHRS